MLVEDLTGPALMPSYAQKIRLCAPDLRCSRTCTCRSTTRLLRFGSREDRIAGAPLHHQESCRHPVREPVNVDSVDALKVLDGGPSEHQQRYPCLFRMVCAQEQLRGERME